MSILFRRPRTLMLVATILLVPGTLLVANMRAAFFRDQGPSGALRPVPGLKVEGERLTFTFEDVVLGVQTDGLPPTKLGRVEAVYRLRSEGEHAAMFEFVAASDASVTASINGTPAEVRVTPSDIQLQFDRSRQVPGRRFTLAFLGSLRPGANEVAVTYTQPLSCEEMGLRYFHRSRWRTFAEYDFWPIKEWVRDPAFRAEVTLSIPRTRKVHDFFFGPSLLLAGETFARKELQGARQPPEARNSAEPAPSRKLPFTLEKTPDRLLAHFTLTGEDLPDLLRVSATEKD